MLHICLWQVPCLTMDFQGRSQNLRPSVHAITALWYLPVSTHARFNNYEKFDHGTNSWNVAYIACTHLPAFAVIWNTLKRFKRGGFSYFPDCLGYHLTPCVSGSYAVTLNTWISDQRFWVCFRARGTQSLFKQMQKLFWNNNAAEFSKEEKQESFSTNPTQA